MGRKRANGKETNRACGSKIHVRISGIQGIHPLQLGVAYWWRGHHLYSAAGVPVMPTIHGTKKCIHIMGLTADHAPPCPPSGAPGEVPEQQIAALHRSMVHTWEEQQRMTENEQKKLEPVAFESQKDEIQNLLLSGQKKSELSHDGRPSHEMGPGGWTDHPRQEVEDLYNGRALFLAHSAPGSPMSRPSSPTDFLGQTDVSGPFRAVASSSQLQGMLQNPRAPLADITKLKRKPAHLSIPGRDLYFGAIGDNRPKATYGSHSRVPSDVETDEQPASLLTGTARNTPIRLDVPGQMIPTFIRANERTSSRLSRTRSDSLKAAGAMLNAVVNDINNKKDASKPSILKCPIHGDDCDGLAVGNDNLTLAHVKARGFEDVYPMLHRDDRSMIDWLAMFTAIKEEMKDGLREDKKEGMTNEKQVLPDSLKNDGTVGGFFSSMEGKKEGMAEK